MHDYREEIQQSISKLVDQINDSMKQSIERIQLQLKEPFKGKFDFSQWVYDLVEEFKKLPERQQEAWTIAAQQGWYVNWHTPFSVFEIVKDPATLDTFMLSHLQQNFSDITQSIISTNPDRSEILECAFDLHVEGKYIASIPLFLAQADGICAEVLGAHLFTENEQREKKILELQNMENDLVSLLTKILTLKTQMNAGIRQSNKKRKKLAPNRNGIMHGSRRHLDYGTEINSYKSLSLLAFVSFVLQDK